VTSTSTPLTDTTVLTDIPDKPISNSTPCDTNISDVIKDLTNVHGDVLVDKSRNFVSQ